VRASQPSRPSGRQLLQLGRDHVSDEDKPDLAGSQVGRGSLPVLIDGMGCLVLRSGQAAGGFRVWGQTGMDARKELGSFSGLRVRGFGGSGRSFAVRVLVRPDDRPAPRLDEHPSRGVRFLMNRPTAGLFMERRCRER